jgi:hypothetical protein
MRQFLHKKLNFVSESADFTRLLLRLQLPSLLLLLLLLRQESEARRSRSRIEGKRLLLLLLCLLLLRLLLLRLLQLRLLQLRVTQFVRELASIAVAAPVVFLEVAAYFLRRLGGGSGCSRLLLVGRLVARERVSAIMLLIAALLLAFSNEL